MGRKISNVNEFQTHDEPEAWLQETMQRLRDDMKSILTLA